MDQDILQKFEEQNKKIDAIYASTEKTRKYILWSFVFSVAVVVLPLIGILALLPWLINTLTSAYSGLL